MFHKSTAGLSQELIEKEMADAIRLLHSGVTEAQLGGVHGQQTAAVNYAALRLLRLLVTPVN